MVGRHWPLLLYPLVYITTKRRKLDWARLTQLVPGTAQELRAFAGIAKLQQELWCRNYASQGLYGAAATPNLHRLERREK
jgi:hypothetical protein